MVHRKKAGISKIGLRRKEKIQKGNLNFSYFRILGFVDCIISIFKNLPCFIGGSSFSRFIGLDGSGRFKRADLFQAFIDSYIDKE